MDQKEKLLKAIDLAKKPGSCKYVIDGEPICVIAQLYVLEGGKVEDMEKWGDTVIQTIKKETEDLPALDGYDINILLDLQSYWDDEKDEEEARKNMRSLVNEVYS